MTGGLWYDNGMKTMIELTLRRRRRLYDHRNAACPSCFALLGLCPNFGFLAPTSLERYSDDPFDSAHI